MGSAVDWYGSQRPARETSIWTHVFGGIFVHTPCTHFGEGSTALSLRPMGNTSLPECSTEGLTPGVFSTMESARWPRLLPLAECLRNFAFSNILHFAWLKSPLGGRQGRLHSPTRIDCELVAVLAPAERVMKSAKCFVWAYNCGESCKNALNLRCTNTEFLEDNNNNNN